MLITESGKTKCSITLLRNAGQIEEFAARELREHLYQISGARVALKHVPSIEQSSEPTILIASGQSGRKPSGGFHLRVEGSRLSIIGYDAAGCLYGVYTFLEKVLGVRWIGLGKNGVVFNRQRTIAVEHLDLAQQPSLKYRGFIIQRQITARTISILDWMAKNKMNYLMIPAKNYERFKRIAGAEAARRGILVEPGHHGFGYWMPGSQYYARHPEYYALLNGRRAYHNDGVAGGAQICLSQPAVRKIIAKSVIAFLDRHPEVKRLGLFPNDGFGWCECENCRKLEPARRSWQVIEYLSEKPIRRDAVVSDSYMFFINDVARVVAQKHPQVTLCFSAYLASLPAPLRNRPAKNVSCSGFCLFWRCYGHELKEAACARNRLFRKHLLGWQKQFPGMDLILYEYYMGVMAYLSLPFPITNVLSADIPDIVRAGVSGIATQAETLNWNAYCANFYLFSKLGWDSGVEAGGVEQDFYRHRYQGAGESMQAYHALWKTTVQKHTDCFYPQTAVLARLVDARLLARGRYLLRTALAQAANRQVRAHIQIDQIILDYVAMMRQLFLTLDKGDNARAGKVRAEILALARQHRQRSIFNYPKMKKIAAEWFQKETR